MVGCNRSWVSLAAAPLALLAAAAVAAAPVEFSEPVAVSPADRKAEAVEVALDTDGRLHMVWVDKGAADNGAHEGHHGAGHDRHHARDDLFYTRSARDTLRFDAPVQVNREPGEVWGFSVSRPRVQVAPSGSVHIMYPANADQDSGGTALVARYVRSDDGTRFEPPRTLNTPAEEDRSEIVHGGFSAAHVFGTLGVAPDGRVHAWWIDTRGMAEDGSSAAIWSAISNDDGHSFGDDFEVMGSGVCPCCQTTAAFTRDGDTVLLGLRGVTEENYRDNLLRASTDGGHTWGEPVRLNAERWQINGCPLKPTAVAADGDRIYTAWYSAVEQPPGAYFTHSTDGGETFSAPRALHPEASLSDAPVVATGGGVTWVVWHARTDEGRRLFLRTSTDGGDTLGDLVEVPGPGTGQAGFPVAAATDDGRLLLGWQQDGRAWALEARAAGDHASHTHAH